MASTPRAPSGAEPTWSETESWLEPKRSTCYLSELVGDLLDLAKVEAGKTVVRPSEFEVAGLTAVKSDPVSQGVPVIVVTTLEDRAKGLALGADAYAVKPVDRSWLLQELRRALSPRRRVLVIDDDEIVRYLLRQRLHRHEVLEAVNGEHGLAEARRARPDVIPLDLVMPDLSGMAVLERLASDMRTHEIPVVLLTATQQDELDLQALAHRTAAVVSKDALARSDQDSALTQTLARLGLP